MAVLISSGTSLCVHVNHELKRLLRVSVFFSSKSLRRRLLTSDFPGALAELMLWIAEVVSSRWIGSKILAHQPSFPFRRWLVWYWGW